MKKFMKQLMASAFVCAMIIALLPAIVQAKTTKKSITLYKGEAIYYTDYTTVKSVKSSNAKVAKASKDKSADYKTNIVAKKAGKTTVIARVGSEEIKCEVIVPEISPNKLSIMKGSSQTLKLNYIDTKKTVTYK